MTHLTALVTSQKKRVIMKKTKQLLILIAALLVLGISRENATAQQGFPSFDPQQMKQMQEQMQQRMMDNIREQLVVTNDADWDAIEPLITKVTQGGMASMMGGMGAMRGMMGNRGGGFPGMGQPDPEAEALQNAIDVNAPTGQVKDLLVKYRESRKRKEDELAKNREQLRQVLTLRQEAVLVLMGILN
jgi:hypothetical protein